jgi:site-specific DNA recombinase
MNHLPPMRAVIYARAATATPAEATASLQMQLAACRAYAQEHGYTIVGEYQDRGVSGSSLDRPGLAALRQTVKHDSASVVIVYDLARLARHLPLFMWLHEELAKLGASLVCAQQNEEKTTSKTLLCPYCTLEVLLSGEMPCPPGLREAINHQPRATRKPQQ